MKFKFFIIWLFLSVFLIQLKCECPNACSSHGKCGMYQMCTCYRNWMGNDCSQRICQFGVAHVDIPKGNLDGSDGSYLTGPDVVVVRNSQLYPFGTSELFPHHSLDNSAHEYAECSNKGYCNRQTGLCECFDGYEGSSCHLSSCPKLYDELCSGHGICVNAYETAQLDYNNNYNIWDYQTSQGCKCDAGYIGPACEDRICKIGFDPMIYSDPDSSVRYANWSIVIATQSPTADIIGNYSIIFYDYTGEDWMTEPIDYHANCHEITSKLENIPNSVIPHNSVLCLQWKDYHKISAKDESIIFRPNPYFGIKTTLSFPKNPGILKQPKLNIHLDGARPTLYSTESAFPMEVFIYPDGFVGEENDYFNENCIGVDVSILSFTSGSIASDGSSSTYQYLSGLTPLEFRLLSQCLGEADGIDNTDNSVAAGTGRVQGKDYSWDYGTKYNPHLVRLVDQTESSSLVTDLCLGNLNSVRDNGIVCSNFMSGKHPSGFIVPLYYDPVDNKFKLLTKPGLDYSPLTTFAVFVTKGIAQMVSDVVSIITNPNQPYSQSIYSIHLRNNATIVDDSITNSNRISPDYQGNIDCETNQPNNNGAFDCIEKEDRIFFLDPSMNQNSFLSNPKYLNIYTVKRIFRYTYSSNSTINEINLDMSINSAWSANNHAARAYIFRPPIAANTLSLHQEQSVSTGRYYYQYVSECSNRGNCNRESGQCECFTGFHGDDCSIQINVIS